MPSNSIMKLKNYSVNKIMFELNNSFDFSSGKEISINPSFRRDISKIDDNNAVVCLSIQIKNDDATALPFSIEISVEGAFELDNWETGEAKTLIENNTVAILFPYLRTLVTMVTSNANLEPYILPVMNIAGLFAESLKK